MAVVKTYVAAGPTGAAGAGWRRSRTSRRYTRTQNGSRQRAIPTAISKRCGAEISCGCWRRRGNKGRREAWWTRSAPLPVRVVLRRAELCQRGGRPFVILDRGFIGGKMGGAQFQPCREVVPCVESGVGDEIGRAPV